MTNAAASSAHGQRAKRNKHNRLMDTAALATEKSFSENVRVTVIRATTPPPLPTGRGQREDNTRCGWIMLHLQTEKSFTEHVRVTGIGPTTPHPLPTGSGQREKNTTGGWRGTAAVATEKSFGEHVRVTQSEQRRLLHCPRAAGQEKTTQVVVTLLQLEHKMFQCCSCIIVVERICSQSAGGKGRSKKGRERRGEERKGRA